MAAIHQGKNGSHKAFDPEFIPLVSCIVDIELSDHDTEENHVDDEACKHVAMSKREKRTVKRESEDEKCILLTEPLLGWGPLRRK